ncbi:Uncharacterised protein [Klebsiella pneumoniae]|nr:Uncharacterised protein [Klebsiella pneumoniae]
MVGIPAIAWQHQGEFKRCAFATDAFHLEIATHDISQKPGNRQPKARPDPTTIAGYAFERLKDAFQVLRGDADAGIVNREKRHLATILEIEGYTASVREFNRIRKQIDKNLPEAFLIRHHRLGQPVWGVVVKCQSFIAGLLFKHGDQLLHQIANAHFFTIYF